MKRFSITFIKILITFTLLAFSGLMLLRLSTSGHLPANAIGKDWWLFAIWRYGILTLVLWKWPAICRHITKRKNLDAEQLNWLLGLRWWILCFVALFEAVFVYGV